MDNKITEYVHVEGGQKVAAMLHPTVDAVRIRFARASYPKKSKEAQWTDRNVTFVRSATAAHLVKALLELVTLINAQPGQVAGTDNPDKRPAEIHIVKTFKDGTGLMLWWNRQTRNAVWEERGANFIPIGFNLGEGESVYCNGVIQDNEIERVCGVISHLAQAYTAELQLQQVQNALKG